MLLQHPNHAIRVRKVGQCHIGPRILQGLHGEFPSGDSHGHGANGVGGGDVVWGVADQETGLDALARLQARLHPLESQLRNFSAVGVFVAEGPQDKMAVEVKLLELDPGAGFDIARDQAEDHRRIG